MYKFAGLCYRDCAQKKLANCGTAACSLTKESCYEGILKITVEFLAGAAKFVNFMLEATNGTNLAQAQNQLQERISHVSQKFLNNAFLRVRQWIGDSRTKQFLVDLMVNFTTKFISAKFPKFLNNSMIARVCGKVRDEAADQISKVDTPDLKFKEISINDVTDTILECANVDVFNGNPNDEIACVRKALTTVSGADVTGLSTIAAAFMNPVCDI